MLSTLGSEPPKSVEKKNYFTLSEAISRAERAAARVEKRKRDQQEDHDHEDVLASDEIPVQTEISITCPSEDAPFLDVATQTDPVASTSDSISQSTESTPPFTVQNFATDSTAIHFYTVLENYDNFRLVPQILGPAAEHLIYYSGVNPPLSIEDQLFLTLVKLQRHPTHFELNRWFGLTETGVANVFVTWLNFMAYKLGGNNWWPSRDLVTFFCPTVTVTVLKV